MYRVAAFSQGEVALDGGPGIDSALLCWRLRYLRYRVVRLAGGRAALPSPPAQPRIRPQERSLPEDCHQQCCSASTMRSHTRQAASSVLEHSSADRVLHLPDPVSSGDENLAGVPQTDDGERLVGCATSTPGTSQVMPFCRIGLRLCYVDGPSSIG